jgi:hypothetical protein
MPRSEEELKLESTIEKHVEWIANALACFTDWDDDAIREDLIGLVYRHYPKEIANELMFAAIDQAFKVQ